MQIFAPDHPLVRNGTYDTEGYKPGERARIAKARAIQERIEMATKRSKKTNGAAGRARTAKPRTPKQPDLPGIEDRAIKPLEAAAAEYVDLRDQRMALNQSESEIKVRLIALMKKNGKTIYRRHGVTIELVTEAETVKVKIAKADTEEEPEGAEAEAADTPEANA